MLYIYFSGLNFKTDICFSCPWSEILKPFSLKKNWGVSVSLIPVLQASAIHSCSVETHSLCIVFISSPNHLALMVTLIFPSHFSQLRLEFTLCVPSFPLSTSVHFILLSLACGPDTCPHTLLESFLNAKLPG